MENVSIAPLKSAKFPVCDAFTGILVHAIIEKHKHVLKTFTTSQKGIDNCLSIDIETLVISTVQKVESSPSSYADF